MGDARYGRRDNGLVAAAYVAAGDVDPRVGEYLLDLLARDGIAAYLSPSSDLYPITRSTLLPRRPTDRLFVDRAHVATARDHLARLAREERETEAGRTDPTSTRPETDRADGGADATGRGGSGATGRGESGATGHGAAAGEPSADEVDRVFAEIVAGFGATTAPDPITSGPDGTAPPTGPSWRGTPERPSRRERDPEPVEEPSLLDGLDTFGADLPDDEPGEFVPPEPPPVPRPSLPTVLAVIGVVGGLAVFLKPDLLSILSESLARFVGFTAVVGGAAGLVWRLRPGTDDEDPDPDHGARV